MTYVICLVVRDNPAYLEKTPITAFELYIVRFWHLSNPARPYFAATTTYSLIFDSQLCNIVSSYLRSGIFTFNIASLRTFVAKTATRFVV